MPAPCRIFTKLNASHQRSDYQMGYLVDSSSHYILGVGVPALVASTIVL